MKNKSEIEALRETIALLEVRQKQELIDLKAQFVLTKDSFKSMNLIKNTLQEISTSPDLRNIILNNTIAVSAGYLSKRILVGSSHNIFKKVAGTFVEFAVASLMVNQAGKMVKVGKKLFKYFATFRKQNYQQDFSIQENDETYTVSTPLGKIQPKEVIALRIEK
jgi:hypothetical protein